MSFHSATRRTLHFDCLSGISGDMTLGALIDLGADPAAVEAGLQSMNLSKLRLRCEEVKKCGFRALQIHIDHPPESSHRHLHHIEAMIDGASGITDTAKALAKSIFGCIGRAEAKVHGCNLQKVHFHEVGAIDSIGDIVGVSIAIDQLNIAHVSSSPIPTGTGSIQIDHGRVAVPAPATAEILCGIPLSACDIPFELTTPTGAAIIATLTETYGGAAPFGAMPAMVPDAVGYGAGNRDLDGQANVLRVTMGHRSDPQAVAGELESDQVVLLETNLDDCDPQVVAGVAEQLMTAGALDAWQTSCTMKKGRLGSVLSVLTTPAMADQVQSMVLTHTTSIGLRRHLLQRAKLPRKSMTVQTPHGIVRGKRAFLPGGDTRFKPEHDDVHTLSVKTGIPATQIARDAVDASQRQIHAAGSTSATP
ncbi:MAG: nickel pincer cofactor biosynthesis protein LarC [Planctomycetota bacterium]